MCECVCSHARVCVCACAGRSNALCETKRNGRMLYDSVISLWVTCTHTHAHTQPRSQRDSIQRLRSPHTLIKTMYLSEKRTLSWDTHTHTHTHTNTHTHRRWRPLSMPLFRTAQLSLCTSLFSLLFTLCLSLSFFLFRFLTIVLSLLTCRHFFHSS